jgi:hypothetical protein
MTVGKLQEAWRAAGLKHYNNTVAPAWRVAQAGRLKTILENTQTMPDPSMSWADVIEWYVRDFARAVMLTTPFMLKTAAQRMDILGNPPQISLFIAFARDYLKTYHTLHYGQGIMPEQLAGTDASHAEHAHWMRRAGLAAQIGADNLPANLMTAEELAEHAENVRGTSAAVGAALDEEDFLTNLQNRMAEAGATEAEIDAEVHHVANAPEAERREVERQASLQAVQDDHYFAIREEFGEELTDDECEEILADMFGEND